MPKAKAKAKTIKGVDVKATLERMRDSGLIFSVKFEKRTGGEMRHMVCRGKVTSHLKGGTPKYDASAKGLINVFDMQKKAYRTIPVENVKEINRLAVLA